MLSAQDIVDIQKARDRLIKLEAKLDLSDDRDYPTGRLAEACRAADDALLNILICANVRDLGVPDSAFAR